MVTQTQSDAAAGIGKIWWRALCMASLAAALAPPPVRIGYVTVVEGNLDYFRRYVRASGVLRFDDDAETVLRIDPTSQSAPQVAQSS